MRCVLIKITATNSIEIKEHLGFRLNQFSDNSEKEKQKKNKKQRANCKQQTGFVYIYI